MMHESVSVAWTRWGGTALRALAVLLALAAPAWTAGSASAAPVDLSTWTSESYPAPPLVGPAAWETSADGAAVTQQRNGQPTIFYSDFSAIGREVSGTVEVGTLLDGDHIGFVLGFEPGDTTSSTADFLLIDWKRSPQYFNFLTPAGSSRTPGSLASRGLSISRVSGIPTADELWGHEDFGANPLGGVDELFRAVNLGDSRWDVFTPIEFRLVYSETRVDLFIDDVLELSVSGSFPEGRVGFYNFSQGRVRYGDVESHPTVPVPEPRTALLLAVGLTGLAATARRRSDGPRPA